MTEALDAIAALPGWIRDGVTVAPLPGGLTNTNYLITRGGERLVLRLSGPNAGPLGIDRRQECRIAATAAALGLGPEVIYFAADGGMLVTRFLAGRAPTPEEMRTDDVMRRVAYALRRVHAVPLSGGDPSYCPFRKAEHWRREAERRGAAFPDDFPVLAEHAAAVERDRPMTDRPRFCHNDPVRGNILIADDGGGGSFVRLIDWEYAGTGDPVFDLAVLSMNNGYDADADERLLGAYFRGDATDDHRRNLRAMKLAFDYHMGVWYVLQTVVSTVDAPFPQGVRWHFDRFRAARGLPVPPPP